MHIKLNIVLNMSDFFKIILKKIRLIAIGNQREKALANYFCKIILNNHISKTLLALV